MAKKNKETFKIGDIIQARYSMCISNNDQTDEESEKGDVFVIIGDEDSVSNYEYKLIRQKSLKISTWDAENLWVNFTKV